MRLDSFRTLMKKSIVLSVCLMTGCSFGGRGRGGTVPTQPDLPPLPEYVEVCVSKVVVLPAKMNGKAWDGVGKINRKQRKLIPDLVAAANGGGYAAAIGAAGSLGTSIFNKVKGPPDLRVQMQLGREQIIRTDMVKDTALAPFEASEANCAVIERKEYSERVQFVVEDMDVGKPEIAGTTSFIGIPVDAIRSGTWQVLGFDTVVEIELTLQPMEKPKRREALPEETEPPHAPEESETGEQSEAGEPSDTDEALSDDPKVIDPSWDSPSEASA